MREDQLKCPKCESTNVKLLSSVPYFPLLSPKDALPNYTHGFKCDSCGLGFTRSTKGPRSGSAATAAL